MKCLYCNSDNIRKQKLIFESDPRHSVARRLNMPILVTHNKWYITLFNIVLLSCAFLIYFETKSFILALTFFSVIGFILFILWSILFRWKARKIWRNDIKLWGERWSCLKCGKSNQEI